MSNPTTHTQDEIGEFVIAAHGNPEKRRPSWPPTRLSSTPAGSELPRLRSMAPLIPVKWNWRSTY